MTDDSWYEFLAARPQLNEVNFWRPSGAREFRVPAPGEPFFFKTHYPHNKVVGGGFFSDSARLRVSEAWEFFGAANGAASIEEMRARVRRYRRVPISAGEDPVIGCLFVRDVRFLAPYARVDAPPAFARNIVQGKSYDMADPATASYFADLLWLTLGAEVHVDFGQPWHRSGPVFGDPRLAPYRLGQGSFKAVVLDAYHRRCAVTGTHIPPVLQAAHIRPVTDGGEHRLDNGLLLRSDIHTLFDRGYLGIDPQFRLRVSPRLRADFSNGEQLYGQQGQVIELPERRADRPVGSSSSGTSTRYSKPDQLREELPEDRRADGVSGATGVAAIGPAWPQGRVVDVPQSLVYRVASSRGLGREELRLREVARASEGPPPCRPAGAVLGRQSGRG